MIPPVRPMSNRELETRMTNDMEHKVRAALEAELRGNGCLDRAARGALDVLPTGGTR